jgi:hypothetical protein
LSNTDFQKGLVWLLRSPAEVNLRDLDLTEAERQNLLFVLNDRMAKKFSRGMEAIRTEIALSGLPMARILFGTEHLTEFYRQFSLGAVSVRGYHLSYAFASYLISVLHSSEPVWVIDCLGYERDLVFLRAFELPERRPSGAEFLPQFVRHARWLAASYSTNVVELCRLAQSRDKRPERSDLEGAVKSLKQYFLLVAADDNIRHFEIDADFFAAVQKLEINHAMPSVDVRKALESVSVLQA